VHQHAGNGFSAFRGADLAIMRLPDRASPDILAPLAEALAPLA
jgi:hypothetical protein